MALTVGLAALCALLAVLWVRYQSGSESVLMLRNDLERGEVVDRDDFAVTSVSAEEPANLIPEASLDAFIGSIAASDLSAGTLPAPDQFRRTAPLNPDESIVGLFLGPGQIPTSRLGPGDRVDVFMTPSPEDPTAPAGVVADGVMVVSVSDDSTSSRAVVSVAVPDGVAGELVSASASDRVWLVQVPSPSDGAATADEEVGG